MKFEKNVPVPWSVFATNFFSNLKMSPSQILRDGFRNISEEGIVSTNPATDFKSFEELLIREGILEKGKNVNIVKRPYEMAHKIQKFYEDHSNTSFGSKFSYPSCLSDSMKEFLGFKTDEAVKKEQSNVLLELVKEKEATISKLNAEVSRLKAEIQEIGSKLKIKLDELEESKSKYLEKTQLVYSAKDSNKESKTKYAALEEQYKNLLEVYTSNEVLLDRKNTENSLLTEKVLKIEILLQEEKDRILAIEEANKYITAEKTKADELIIKKDSQIKRLMSEKNALTSQIEAESYSFETFKSVLDFKLEEVKNVERENKITNFSDKVHFTSKKWTLIMDKYGYRVLLFTILVFLSVVGAFEGLFQGGIIQRGWLGMTVQIVSVLGIALIYRAMIIRDFNEVIDTTKLDWKSFDEKDKGEPTGLYNKNRKIQSLLKNIGSIAEMPQIIWLYDLISLSLTSFYYIFSKDSSLLKMCTFNGITNYLMLSFISVLFSSLFVVTIHLLIYAYGKVKISHLYEENITK